MGIFTEHDGRSISSGIEVLARMDDEGVAAFQAYDEEVEVLFELETSGFAGSQAEQGSRQLTITLDDTNVIHISVTAYGNNAESALNSTQEKIISLERLWSVTDENSEIYAVNHSDGETVELSSETAELLRYALNISDVTDGALDCTLYPVLTQWGFTTRVYQVPDDKILSELLENTGYEKVQLNGNHVTIPRGMQLDLGAVGKGYAGDLAATILKENGVESALLDLGGNIHAIGSKPDGTPWRLGLRNPFGEGSFATLEISNCAVITSGGYERYFTDENGEEYHQQLYQFHLFFVQSVCSFHVQYLTSLWVLLAFTRFGIQPQ